MKKMIMSSLAFLCLLCFACQSPTTVTHTSAVFEVPELLDRSEAIQNGKEWEKIQNIYTASKLNAEKDPDELVRLAEVFITEARVTGEHGHYYPGALKVLNRAIEQKDIKSDTYFRALSLKASVQLSQHEFAEALETAKKAVVLNPYNASVYGALVDAHVELGNYEEAVKMADKMISIRPDLRSYARVSYLRQIHGQIDGAIESMNMAVSAGFPGFEETSWTRLTLGDLYKHYGQLDKAEMQYQLALNERENYSFAIAALADIAILKGDEAKAEKLLKEACAIIPEVGFYTQLAALYQQQGKTEQVEKLLSEIQEMLHDDVVHGHNMNLEYADLHLNLTHDYDASLQYAMDEYKKRPENIDVNKMLAFIYFAKNDYTAAQSHLDAAKRTGTKDPDLLCIDGLLAIRKGQQKDGITFLKKSFQMNPHQTHVLAEVAKKEVG